MQEIGGDETHDIKQTWGLQSSITKVTKCLTASKQTPAWNGYRYFSLEGGRNLHFLPLQMADRDAERQRETHTQTERERERRRTKGHTNTQTHIHTDRQTATQTDRNKDTHIQG